MSAADNTRVRVREAGSVDVAFGMVSLEDAERMVEDRYWEGYALGMVDGLVVVLGNEADEDVIARIQHVMPSYQPAGREKVTP